MSQADEFAEGDLLVSQILPWRVFDHLIVSEVRYLIGLIPLLAPGHVLQRQNRLLKLQLGFV